VGFTELVPTQSSYSGKAQGLGLYPTQISLGIRVLIHAGGRDQCCLVIQFLDKTPDMNKELFLLLKKSWICIFKISHIFIHRKLCIQFIYFFFVSYE
jgi:hypothetical protein